MNIRKYVIGLSAIALLGLANSASAHGSRHGHGYDYGYKSGHYAAPRHVRRHHRARHYRKHARHAHRHFRRSHRHHGVDLYFDGLSVRLYDNGRRHHRY